MQESDTEFVFVASTEQIEQLPHVLRDLAVSVQGRPLRSGRDHYLDTPTRLLMKAGVVCRLRRVGKQVTLALNSLTPLRDGLATRVELNEGLPQGDWAGGPGPLPGCAIRAKLAPLTRRLEVHDLFTLNQERRVYDVHTGDGARLEVSAARVGLAGSDCKPVLRRIGVAWRTGSPESLSRFAADLRHELKLKPANESEFECGLRAAGLVAPVLAEGSALRIRPGDSVQKAVARGLLRHFRRMLWHVQGTRLGVNPECLHDMRVSVRRLRAFLQLFRADLPANATAKVATELRWLGQSLGAVRDLDVHIQACSTMLRRIPEAPREAANQCQLEMGRRREQAYDELRRDLCSSRFKALQATCRNLIRRLRRPTVAGSAKIAMAGSLLMKAELRKILKAGRAVTAETPDEVLHRLRVRCKRLRYACEFLSELDGKPVAKMMRRLAVLQDVLGAHQDAVAAQALIERAIAETAAATPGGEDATDALRCCAAGWRKEQLARRAAFPEAWKAFDRKKVRRAFLKAI